MMHFAPFLAFCLAAVAGVHAQVLRPYPLESWAGIHFTDERTLLNRYCMGNINFSCVSLYVFDTDRIPRFAHRDAGGYNNYLPAECAYRKHSIDAFNDASTKEYFTCAFRNRDMLFTINCNDRSNSGVEAVFAVEIQPRKFAINVVVGPNNLPSRAMRHLFFEQGDPNLGSNFIQEGNNNGAGVSVANITSDKVGIDLAVACAV